MTLSLRSAVAAIVVFAMPALAFAYYTKPGELLGALTFRGKPVDVAYQMSVRSKEVWGTAELKGEWEGTDVATMKANMQLSLDVSTPEAKIKAKGQMRIAQKTVYLLLENIESSVKNDDIDAASKIAGKQWYSVSLDDLASDTEKLSGVENEKAVKAMADLANAAFSLTAQSQKTGRVYSLKLRRNAAKDILAVVQRFAAEEGVTRKPTNRELAEFRKILSKLNIQLKVTTDSADQPLSLKTYVAIRHQMGTAAIQGTVALRSKPVTVTVPANAVEFDKAVEALGKEQISIARDAQRTSDVNVLLNAVYQYAIDSNGKLPEGIPLGKAQEICASDTDCSGMVNLRVLTGAYLIAIPRDPSLGSKSKGSGYFIKKDKSNRITVEAIHADKGRISVTR